MSEVIGKNFEATFDDDGVKRMIEGKIFDGVDEAGEGYIMLAMKEDFETGFWDILPEDGLSSEKAFNEGFKFGWFVNPNEPEEESISNLEIF